MVEERDRSCGDASFLVCKDEMSEYRKVERNSSSFKRAAQAGEVLEIRESDLRSALSGEFVYREGKNEKIW